MIFDAAAVVFAAAGGLMLARCFEPHAPSFRATHVPVQLTGPLARALRDVGDQAPRVLAIESALDGRIRVLTDGTCARRPLGFVADGHLWTADGCTPEEEVQADRRLLRAPLELGSTENGPMIVDLEALGALWVSGEGADLHSVFSAIREVGEVVGFDVELIEDETTYISVRDRVACSQNAGHGTLRSTEMNRHELARVVVAVAGASAISGGWIDPVAGLAVVALGEPPDQTSWHLSFDGKGAELAPLGLALTDVFSARRSGIADGSEYVEAAVADNQQRGSAPLVVRVLGPVSIEGAEHAVSSPKVIELVAYLAFHPHGVTDQQIRTAIWPDRDIPTGTFNNTVSLARRLLGRAPDGYLYLPHAVGHRYRLSSLITTDVGELERALAKEPPDVEALRAAVGLIVGQPFALASGFEWAHTEGVADAAAMAAAKAAHWYAEKCIAGNLFHEAERAARFGLQAAPGDYRLYEALASARRIRGDDIGVERLLEEYREVSGQQLALRGAPLSS